MQGRSLVPEEEIFPDVSNVSARPTRLVNAEDEDDLCLL